MGNCQAEDAAAVVVHHPGDDKVERLYWLATTEDVMRGSAGHYVTLVVLHVSDSGGGGGDAKTDPAVTAFHLGCVGAAERRSPALLLSVPLRMETDAVDGLLLCISGLSPSRCSSACLLEAGADSNHPDEWQRAGVSFTSFQSEEVAMKSLELDGHKMDESI